MCCKSSQKVFYFIYRGFATYEEGGEVDTEKEHQERILLNEYQSKLKAEDELIPDLLDLMNGWKGEEHMTTWPKLYLTDIIRFYNIVLSKRGLIQRIECEYKQGKAYRYYTNSFIGEVLIHLNGNSKFCLFRTKCVPSQRVTMRQYDVWASVRKDSIETVGGEIMNAYCTCTAGLLGSCNHVTGLLFRIEAAVLLGHAHQTCTSQLSQWNITSHKEQK